MCTLIDKNQNEYHIHIAHIGIFLSYYKKYSYFFYCDREKCDFKLLMLTMTNYSKTPFRVKIIFLQWKYQVY